MNVISVEIISGRINNTLCIAFIYSVATATVVKISVHEAKLHVLYTHEACEFSGQPFAPVD